MRLVNEDKHGAYRGVREELLRKFILKESNPNFEVCDSIDGNNRFIAVKSSRIPDDEDLTAGRYGIDFNRAKPTLQESLQYKAALPHALESLKWINNFAFAAASKEEYDRKSATWDCFYSYIWGSKPIIIWVTPHSGDVTRTPDDILPFPKQQIDAFTAGVAALCAFNNNNKASKRVMIALHSPNLFLTVFDIGDFGVLNEAKLNSIVKKMEIKYHKKVQVQAGKLKQSFVLDATRMLERINKTRATLNPEELKNLSTVDQRRVEHIAKGLRLYGQVIKIFTLEEFKEAMHSLNKTEISVMTYNYLFPSRHVSRLLKVSENIGKGLLDYALNIECSKVYLAKEPELISNIILDTKQELFD